MSRRARVGIRLSSAAIAAGALAIALGAAAANATAQQSDARPTEEELLRRIESLVPEVEAARRAASAAEERAAREAAARPRAPTEVVRVGPLRILTLPAHAEVTNELFTDVWREHFAAFAGSAALADHLFVFQWGWGRPEPLFVDPSSEPVRRLELTRAWVRTRSVARLRIRSALWAALTTDLPEAAPLRRWLGTAGYPETERIARLVAGTPSVTGRACLEGDTDSCLAALGLAGEEMTFARETSASLLVEAVRLGGGGAWERLLQRSDAPPLEALTHAAGVDADELLDAWRLTLLGQAPEFHAGLGGQAGRVLLWVLILVACTTRSTRWRVA
jgi:hypothetical protein